MSTEPTDPKAGPKLLARRRQLAAELRRLRTKAGLSTHQLAEQLGASQSKVTKIENARRAASIPDVRAWARLTGATGATGARLVYLAEHALTDTLARRAILRGQGGVAAHQASMGELERRSGLICEYEPVYAPGLLQTADYAAAVMNSVVPGRDVSAWVAARTERQTILRGTGRRFRFLLAEGVLRWRAGPAGVHLAQLARLAEALDLEHVDLAVLPQATAAPVWHNHGFVIFDRLDAEDGDEGDALAYAETLTQELRLSDPDDVAIYRDVFARLRAGAVAGDEARRLIAEAAEELRRLGPDA